MQQCSTYLVIIWILLSLSEPVIGADAASYIESFEHGHINWSTGEVQVVGIGVPSEKISSKSPDANVKILSLARNTAKQNLFELLQAVGVDSKQQVAQLVAANSLLLAKLKEMVYDAKELEGQRKYMTDGTVAVVLTFSLHGGFSQLVLPKEIKQIQPITQVIPNSNSKSPSQSLNLAGSDYTGLVVDARGIDLKPVIAPKILDEKGQEIYGATVISREFAVQRGITRYFQRVESADHAAHTGRRPLIVKGLRTVAPGNCDIVISNTDAEKLRRSSRHLSFLKQCRVAIVLGSQP